MTKYTMLVVKDTRRILDADLVLLAMGFVHPALEGLLSELELELDQRKNIKVDQNQLNKQTKSICCR